MIQPNLLFVGFPAPFPDFEVEFEFEWFEFLFDECFAMLALRIECLSFRIKLI